MTPHSRAVKQLYLFPLLVSYFELCNAACTFSDPYFLSLLTIYSFPLLTKNHAQNITLSLSSVISLHWWAREKFLRECCTSCTGTQ